MDTGRIPAKLELNKGNLAENWRVFKQDVDWYIDSQGKSDATHKVRIGLFMNIAGKEAQDIFHTLGLSDEDKKKYDKVTDAYKNYCNPRKRVLFERHIFTRSKQEGNDESGETVDQYLTRLKTLVKNCEYADSDEMVRDQFVFGLRDNGPGGIMERIFREENIDLTKAVDMARASEASKSQMKLLRERENKFKSVEAVSTAKKKEKVYSCKKCGYKHAAMKCPAHGKTCGNCGEMNHFSKCCTERPQGEHSRKDKYEGQKSGQKKKYHHAKKNQRKVHEMQEDSSESESDDHFIGVLSVGKGEKDWTEHLMVNENKFKVKLDTGAQCSVMSERIYEKLTNEPLKPTTTRLVTFSKDIIKPIGKISLACKLVNGSEIHKIQFEVVKEELSAILGKDDCVKLGVIKRHIHKIGQTNSILDEYPDVFEGVGLMPGKYSIVVDPDVKPVVHAPRRVPYALKDELKVELESMEKKGIIRKVHNNEPTDWVNSMVVVRKPAGGVRVCLDPKDLNKAIKREFYPMPTHEQITAKLAGAKYFTVLDAEKAFFQIDLDGKSQKLLTFNSPFGRYQYCRMPMGISSASEVFQKRMHECLEGLENVEPVNDDILVWGRTQEEHDKSLKSALDRLRENNVKLNKAKSQICQPTVRFHGHKYSQNGVEIDQVKVEAIMKMPTPENKEAVQRFLGMLNYLSKYIPNMSDKTASLRELLKKDVVWHWSKKHDDDFKELKEALCKAPVLQYYDASKPLTLQVDSSSKGVGCVLLQNDRPVAYASQALTQSQQAYAQIEKELFAIVIGCKKFEDYIVGRTAETTVQTDHKPLESIMRKPLYKAPTRLQKMLIELQRYPEIEVVYLKGKDMIFADTLSRAYLENETRDIMNIESQLDEKEPLSVSQRRHQELIDATQEDKSLQMLKKVILQGWPDEKCYVPPECMPYWNYRDELTCRDGLLFKGNCIIVPKKMRATILSKMHKSHLGMVKTKQRARDIVFWPGMASDIEDVIKQCIVCIENQAENAREPMKSHHIPDTPWSKVGSDLFQYEGNNYITVVDYYSKFPEVRKLSKTTSKAVINSMKSIFAVQGIPEEVVTDNGPCYNSSEFAEFAREWNFIHTTSSPGYPKSNGQAESSVKIIKNLLKKSADPALAMLEYRTTPLEGINLSPSQMLNSRRLRSILPTARALLSPEKQPNVIEKLKEKQSKQKYYYDRTAKKMSSPELHIDEPIRFYDNKRSKWQPATVTKVLPHRSYMISTPEHQAYRRTRSQLLKTGEPPHTPRDIAHDQDDITPPSTEPPTSAIRDEPPTIRTSDRVRHPPKRLITEM